MRNKSFPEILNILFELAKVKVTLLVTFTTATGFLLFDPDFSLTLVYAAVGIFILASGSAVINQIQERHIDILMPRTRHRPLPSGKTSVQAAIGFALLLVIAGSLLLYFGAGFNPLILGLFTLLWYNGVYTNLKRITAFAVVPGSIVGAIPPVIGWTAAGGYIFDFQILALAFYLFVWQIPHFWLLLLMYGKDYEIADLPTLSKIFSLAQIKRLTFTWIIATIASATLFAVFIKVEVYNFIIIVFLSAFLLLYSIVQILKSGQMKTKQLFIFINLYTLLVLLISIINQITTKL